MTGFCSPIVKLRLKKKKPTKCLRSKLIFVQSCLFVLLELYHTLWWLWKFHCQVAKNCGVHWRSGISYLWIISFVEWICDCQPNSVFHCGEAFLANNLSTAFHRFVLYIQLSILAHWSEGVVSMVIKSSLPSSAFSVKLFYLAAPELWDSAFSVPTNSVNRSCWSCRFLFCST